MVKVKYSDLSDAFDFVSFGSFSEHQALVSVKTGAIYWFAGGESMNDDELPDDIEMPDRYIEVPSKDELGLGSRLALGFAEEQLPHQLNRIVGFFRHPGAYRRFKDLLEFEGRLEKWYAYEAEATEKALRVWCVENDIQLDDAGGEKPA
jgi:hypothetical protein